ncbi:MAG: cellulase family glycosylhydrolase [Cytophagales bacterium]|nr:cellulase family glycosylhydrolase [Cytophagales bacterium]
MKIIVTSFLLIFATYLSQSQNKWTIQQAKEWQAKYGWMTGCNYINASSINQIEMWQADTFNPQEIDKELGWAKDIGFTFMRVFLHNVVWQNDPTGFKVRIKKFLDICEKHNIKVMFVFFDDCWYGNPRMGKQNDPVPGLHNSYWLQSPSFASKKNPASWGSLENYVKDILTTFGTDKRVIIWDLYNEPGNNDFYAETLPLLKNTVTWFRQVNPSQPMTIGVWQLGNIQFREVTNYSLEVSDIVSFHCYGGYENMRKDIDNFKSFGLPVICTEYLARGYNNTFEEMLPLMKTEGVIAINWGFVDGKTQTKYPWGSKPNAPEPEIWHHDVLRKDGKPYDEKEVKLIMQLTGK